jgi:putative ABC transport system ATP-binding protein
MSSQPTYLTTAVAPGHTDRPVSGGHRTGANDARPAVLELHEVTKTYGAGAGGAPVYALRGVSLTVEQGELVAIVGPSGSGKTTLLHIIGTLDRPTSGTVRIDGIDVAGLDDRQLAALRARSIGFVFQQFFLAEHQTVLDNVADGLLYAGVEVRERRELAARALDAVGLAERQHARPTTMSGGQRQRIAIARALVGQPAIVLADEPTGNLDSHTGEQILELLQQLNKQGTTIIVITHDHDLANRLQRQVHVRDGLIVSDTTNLPQAAGTNRTDDQR